MATAVRQQISRRAARLQPSAIRRLFDRAATMTDVISLGIGEPDFVTPSGIRTAAIRSIEEGQTGYTSNYGILPLRRAIADYVRRLHGIDYDPATEILVTIGVAEGLDLAFRATIDPSDEVLVPDPSYLNYGADIGLCDGAVVPVPTSAGDGFILRGAAVAARIGSRTKAIVIGYPSNPTGAVLDRAALSDLAAVAAERDLLIYSDEIYSRLVYGVDYTSIIEMPGARERTIFLSGLSKSHAMTGWRVGFACGPARLIEQMMRIRQYTTLCPPTASQYAAVEALTNGEPDVQRMVAEYDGRRRAIVDRFRGMGLNTPEPDGAFYAFPRIAHTGLDDVTFCDSLLEEAKVVMVPGSTFGECGAGHARASYAISLKRIDEACDRIAGFLGRL
jgi:aminotransferase